MQKEKNTHTHINTETHYRTLNTQSSLLCVWTLNKSLLSTWVQRRETGVEGWGPGVEGWGPGVKRVGTRCERVGNRCGRVGWGPHAGGDGGQTAVENDQNARMGMR